MKNVAFAVVALGLVACNSSPARPADTGMITLGGDTGVVTGHDAGTTPPTDTGVASGSCGTLGTGTWPALPAGCLPRCSAATAMAHDNCITMNMYGDGGIDQTAAQTCITAAYAADHTASTTVTDGTDTITITCGGNDATMAVGCEDWQTNAAVDTVCDSDFVAYLTCAQGLATGADPTTGCPTQYAALNSCVDTNQDAFQTAVNSLVAMCFSQT